MGLLYSEIGKYAEAEYYLNQALNYTVKIRDPYSIMHIYASLSRHYTTRRDFKKGDLYANMATLMGDSLYKEENNENSLLMKPSMNRQKKKVK